MSKQSLVRHVFGPMRASRSALSDNPRSPRAGASHEHVEWRPRAQNLQPLREWSSSAVCWTPLLVGGQRCSESHQAKMQPDRPGQFGGRRAPCW